MNSTLLLNADGTPTSLIPMSELSWQDACKHLYTGHAEPLHFYDNWFVRSQKIEYCVPAVMILKEQVLVKRRLRCETKPDTSGPTNSLVFLRDGFICQYCNEKFPQSKLTIDHVLPKYYGGKTTWLNCTTSCSDCNGRRGHNTKIQPRIKPFRPSYGHLVKMMKRFPIFIPHESWNYYLGWSEELVNVITPQKSGLIARGFYDDSRIKLLAAE